MQGQPALQLELKMCWCCISRLLVANIHMRQKRALTYSPKCGRWKKDHLRMRNGGSCNKAGHFLCCSYHSHGTSLMWSVGFLIFSKIIEILKNFSLSIHRRQALLLILICRKVNFLSWRFRNCWKDRIVLHFNGRSFRFGSYRSLRLFI